MGFAGWGFGLLGCAKNGCVNKTSDVGCVVPTGNASSLGRCLFLDRAAAGASGSGCAAEAMPIGADCSCDQILGLNVVDGEGLAGLGLANAGEVEHLVEVAVVDLTVPADGEGVAAHEAGEGGGVEAVDEDFHVAGEVAAGFEPVEVAGDGHVGEGDEPIEADVLVLGEAGFPFLFEAGLVAGEVCADGVGDEGEATLGIALAVADLVELAEGFDRFFVGAVAALAVGVALAVVGEGADDFDVAICQPLGEVAAAGEEEDGEVAAIDDLFAAFDAGVYEVAKVGVEFRGSAGDVDGGGGGLVEEGEAGVDGGAVHVFGRAIGACIDVAMATAHVAEFADVDLEDVEAIGGEVGPPGGLEGVAKVAGFGAGDLELVEELELSGGVSEAIGLAVEGRLGHGWD
jgi:hypothetical protein